MIRENLFIGQRTDRHVPIRSVFGLIGRNEDALTYTVGYLMALNQRFLGRVLLGAGVIPSLRQIGRLSEAQVFLQEFRDQKKSGRRDITVEIPGRYRVVFEAKIDGSIPSVDQLAKYSWHDEEWEKFPHKFLIVLTRRSVPKGYYESLQHELDKVGKGIKIKSIQWGDILSVIKTAYREAHYQQQHPAESTHHYWYELLKQAYTFIMEDYQMRTYEQEVMRRHVMKDVYRICNQDPLGFYFDGARDYPDCLYFLACHGPARRAKRTGEFIRRIDTYDILSASQILIGPEPMRSTFKEHLRLFPGDEKAEKVRVFTLGNKIPIPIQLQTFNTSDRSYVTIDEALTGNQLTLRTTP